MFSFLAQLLIRGYQWTIRPLIGSCCRFYPSCSDYALEAFKKRGVLKGGWLTFIRLLKCGPWHPGGVDMVDGLEDSENVSEKS